MSGLMRWSFVALMLALTAVFGVLGSWQVQRLGEKEALVAAVEAGLASPPAPLEAAAEYRPVSIAGSYLPGTTVLVFTSLGDAKGTYGGPGYWVLTALALDGGGSVFINRGFVPQGRETGFLGDVPVGPQQLTGLARSSEAVTAFTPEPRRDSRIDWVRTPERLATFAAEPLPQPLSSFTIDLPAGAPGELPQGGETVLAFPNNHLGYAITWFGFALLTPVLLAYWLLRQRQGKR